MGRRKKVPENVHREAIASAAENLFTTHGVQGTTMDEIAKESGYSKATLYVYFKDKEALTGYLVLRSMKMLCSRMKEAVSEPLPAKAAYLRICLALAEYQEQYPLYFSLALGKINMNMEQGDSLSAEKEIFEVGEEINRVLSDFFETGASAGELRPGGQVLPTVFLFWGALSGLIQIAASKNDYMEKAMGITKQQFLNAGFERLFSLIIPEAKK